jgi:hypothetical protein
MIKGKRGRKRKASALEVMQTKRVRKSELKVAKEEIKALKFEN